MEPDWKATFKSKLNHQFAILLEVESNVELIIQAAIGFNRTLDQLVEENETLRNRQAAAAVLSVCQLLIFLVYLVTIGISYLVKCFKVQ